MASDAAHRRAPLFESLRSFVERDQAPFYSPGHKGGRTLDPWFREHIAAVDLNNLADLDTLHCPSGPILEAEALIADAWGATASFILVQGSTGGNIAVALSALRPEDPVLVQRNAHKSVLAGLVQSGARPIWLAPQWDAEFGVAHGLSVDQVDAALAAEPAVALWILHPTYFGTTADITALADVCRRRGVRLLADGAHSPHFAFHPELPTAAETAGAAATVQSVHKILSGLSQAAVLHVDTDQLDVPTVRRSLQLIQTTSPHFAIMASIDLARRQMITEGRELLDVTLRRARRTAARLAEIPGLRVFGDEDLTGPGSGSHQRDATKLLIGTAGLGADAGEILAQLTRIHGVQPELAGSGHILCITTIGNTDTDMDRLVDGFADIAQRVGLRDTEVAADAGIDVLGLAPEPVLTPREAFFAATATVALQSASDRIAAEPITPYPPGIPLVMPGERLSAEVLDALRALRAADNPISAADPTLERVTVVR
ncbi:aminotransferase class I/II-fold pyridoxal phosphate-dependent enzyme [Mycolicibacterium litorale]|uniref:aminotransferase class I/II-fold pyridoxal phosphate-dependent enzyme n=1 Tax=Mycolicibacterium litorale TaxID=758802 RepID=UPI003CE97849